MIAIYARVSTKGQEKDGHSLDTQEERGREFAVRQGEDCEVYREAKSGKLLENREEWKRLEKDVEAGLIDAVWIIDADRLARNMLDSLLMLKVLEEQKVDLHVDMKKVDYDNYDDMMLFQIQGSIAERNGKAITDGSKRGIVRGLDNGSRATNKLYGYRRVHNPDGSVRWEIVPEQAAAIRRMFELYLGGMSIKKTTQTLNGEGRRSWAGGPFEDSKINRSLKQCKYVGLSYDTKGELIPSKVYKPIIDRETWNRAQELVKLNPSRSFKKKSDHISTGLLECGKCGARYHFHTFDSHGRRVGYYSHHSGIKCTQHPVLIRSYFLDTLFSVLYLSTIQNRGAVEKLYRDEQRKTERDKRRLQSTLERLGSLESSLREKKSRIVNSIANGTIEDSDAAPVVRRFNRELEEVERSRADAVRSMKSSRENYDLLLAKYGAENLLKFADGPNMLKREMLRSMIEEATITDRKLLIRMVTGQTFLLAYPKARRDKDHDIWEYDEDFIYEYIETIELEFSSTNVFREIFDKKLEQLDTEVATGKMNE